MSENTTETDVQEPDAEATDEQHEDQAEQSLGDAGKKALDRMKADRNAARAERDALQSRLDAIEREGMTDLERAQQERDQAQARLAEIERTAMVQRVALDKGIPPTLVDRLRGDTEDELSADADALLALVNAPRRPAPDPSQGGRGSGPVSSGDLFAEVMGQHMNT